MFCRIQRQRGDFGFAQGMERLMNKWEVWWARVKFEDSEEVKKRPVIIYDNKVTYIVSFKVTSHEVRKNFKGEYEIIKWQKAGLAKPSVVRLSRMLKMLESDFIEKIGDLDDIDIYGIETLVRFHYNIR